MLFIDSVGSTAIYSVFILDRSLYPTWIRIRVSTPETPNYYKDPVESQLAQGSARLHAGPQEGARALSLHRTDTVRLLCSRLLLRVQTLSPWEASSLCSFWWKVFDYSLETIRAILLLGMMWTRCRLVWNIRNLPYFSECIKVAATQFCLSFTRLYLDTITSLLSVLKT